MMSTGSTATTSRCPLSPDTTRPTYLSRQTYGSSDGLTVPEADGDVTDAIAVR